MPNQTKEKQEPIKINLKHILFIITIIAVICIICIYYYHKKQKSINNNQIEEVKPITTFNQDESVRLLSKYLEERELAKSNPTAIIERYGLATSNAISSFEKTQDNKYLKTNILYNDIKKIFNQYITTQYFFEEFKDIYKDTNGIVYITTNNNEKKYYQISRSEHVSSTPTKECISVWYFITTDDKTSEEKNMEVEFTKTNGVWLISNIK